MNFIVHHTIRLAIFLFSILIFAACSPKNGKDRSLSEGKVRITIFGTMPDGREVNAYTLTNKNGTTMTVINYGGIITSLKTRDRNGDFDDIVLGYDSLSSYLKENPYFGALIGRYGNRIADGTFSIDETTYTLARNDGPNHLHGGDRGFDKVFWNIEVPDSDKQILKLSYQSSDGEEGYPGTLQVEVYYHLTDADELRIEYKATTDKPTIVNLTQHSYFNLGGAKAADILSHHLSIDADYFLTVNETLIPTGDKHPVVDTPFDFRNEQLIGSRIEETDTQLTRGRGYDHCWILNGDSNTLRKVALLRDTVTGRTTEVHTTEPGLQFYSGNFLDGTLSGKNERIYTFRSGLCLETQHFPDSPNNSSFPSTTLRPGEIYRTQTVYVFGVD